MVHLFHRQEVDIHSDIDHALDNSSMLVKISSAYFVDYPSVSGHKPLMVYCKKITTDESFLLSKKFVSWDRYKCLEQKKEICYHNKFEILSEEIGNEELSIDCVIEKFINTTNSIAKGFIDYIFNRNQKSDV